MTSTATICSKVSIDKGVRAGSLPESASHAGNDQPIHNGKTEKTGEKTSSNNSTNGTFVVQIADQQFNQPEQNNFCGEGPQSKVDFIGIQPQQSDHWFAGGVNGDVSADRPLLITPYGSSQHLKRDPLHQVLARVPVGNLVPR